MLKKTLSRILEPRHFWRNTSFSELNELYASNLLRRFSMSILMIFVPIYLYKNSYSTVSIFLLFGALFGTRVVLDVVAGFSVARYGPKHTMIISTILQVISSALLITVPYRQWPVALMGAILGASISFYFISFHVEFSKIKHTKHAGAEIGYMNIVERIGAALGPAVGGVLAVFFGGPSIFVVATLMAFGSLWPLFRSAEPVKTHQKLNFRSFPLENAKRDILSSAAFGLENTLCLNLWPFYVGLFVLSGSVYIGLGAMSTVAVLAAVFTAQLTGKLLDNGQGLKILRISVALNSLLLLIRPLVQSVPIAYIVSMVNEIITNGYRMPYTKGMYAAADDLPGYRIVYVVAMEAVGSITKATAWVMLALIAASFGTYTAITTGFIAAAIASLLITTERFKVLRPAGSTIKV